MTDDSWVPSACTLPTVDRPLREAEFDDLFTNDVVTVEQSPHAVRLELRPEPEVAARAAGLAARETGCCSFFAFDLSIAEGRAELVVSTASTHGEVLAALADRARSRVAAS